MKLLKKVSSREVKRTFVIADNIRIQKSGRRYLGKVSKEEFLKKFKQSEQRGVHMTDAQLNRYLAEDSQRLRAYESYDWYIGEVKPSEVGVWRRAGELPLTWTNGSLKDTADKIRRVLEKDPGLLTGRARHTIPNMLATNVDVLQSQKYLLPIIFQGGTGTRGRSRLKRTTRGDIDDGNMRSIALAVHGVKVIRAYIGFPKGVKAVH